MASTVVTLADYADQILAETISALDTTDAKAPAVQEVSPGEPSLDCPEMVAVWVVGLGFEQTQPSTPAPAAGYRFKAPYAMNLAAFGLIITRCQPTPGPPRNSLPSEAVITAHARTLNQDLWAAWNWMYQRKEQGDFLGGTCSAFYLDPPSPIALQGQTAGWRMQFRARIDGYNPVPAA